MTLSIIIGIIIAWLLLRGPAPRPWTEPGYGKRRDTQWMKDWREKEICPFCGKIECEYWN